VIPEKCIICGGVLESRFPEVRDPHTGETFGVATCVRCGLGHTVPQPAELGRYYGEYYYGNRHGMTLRHCIKRRLGFVRTAVPDGKGKRLLDIGCGDGSFLLAAQQAGWNVTGTELNPVAAREAGLNVLEAIEEVPESTPFDCITTWHSLEHIHDIPRMLEQIARRLTPDGKLIVAVPDFGGLQARIFGPRWLHVDVPRHLYHFTAGSLQQALSDAGFSVQRAWHQEFEYDLMGWSQSALNYLMLEPNIFFNELTGKKSGAGRSARLTGIVLGSLATLLSLPALVLSTLLGKGGSLIVVATPRNVTNKVSK
jgi:SAM-dependent methyltransferase